MVKIGAMSENEWRSYKLRGELPAGQWRTVVDMLGILGLGVIPTDEQTEQLVASETTPTTIYSLSEITSSDTYVGNEHAEEFWLLYMQKTDRAKHSNITQSDAGLAFSRIAEPKPRRGYLSATPESSRTYAQLLGLDIEERLAAGFPESPQRGTVATAGSFITVVRHISDLEVTARPKGIAPKNLLFLNAFADYLEESITGSENAAM